MEKPTQKRKQREKEARREEILDAAAIIFSRKGYAATTLDQIAAEAELAKGTLYNYYKDKQHLVMSLVVRGNNHIKDSLQESIRLGEKDDLAQFVNRILGDLVRAIVEHRYLFWLFLDAIGHISREQREELMIGWKKYLDDLLIVIADALSKQPQAATMTRAQLLTAAGAILGTARFLFTCCHSFGTEEISSTAIKEHSDFIFRGIIGHGGEEQGTREK